MSSSRVDAERGAERRWIAIGVCLTVSLLATQLVVGLVRQLVHPPPSYLQKVETCLTERGKKFAPALGDPIAQSAKRGALRTTLGGNSVTIVLGGSEKDAARIYADYAEVGSAGFVRTQLEQHRKVVFVWGFEPSAEQRQFVYLCTMDAQD